MGSHMLQHHHRHPHPSQQIITKCRMFSSKIKTETTTASYGPLEEVTTLPSPPTQNDLADAIRPFFTQQRPVIVRRGCQFMSALDKWSNLSYFQKIIPSSEMGTVEIGGSYSNGSTDRAEIPIHDYLHYLQFFEERHGKESSKEEDLWQRPQSISSEELVYMAQNDLPQSLYSDIIIPDFCQEDTADENSVGYGRLYSVMWWVGPKACISPLHFDPLDNLLMQFSGRKVVWLLDPQGRGEGKGNDENTTLWHYAGHEGQQPNTSPVNPEQVDIDQYPMFIENGPNALRSILEPGDILYIPSKWWHYVRSLDTSISVNIWWR